ncbi:MAG: SUMF1/EgtB/PvdO family nonheme iron enzyme [Phycisphaerae bacterium]|nr:SUMF1/EgtB/PvdO family nonheme iron enzyme [Phycisphaerae bacterium]MDD5380932.1 SUMF1/EgtB/PvdO family nonheme iron enzyme [Phycisphaerae bacterium]
MKNAKTTICLAVVCVMTAINFASAELIRGIDIDFVTIGNPGNPGDTRVPTPEYGATLANPYGCGAVSYNYRIGKYEVTNAQWNAFTAAAGAPTGNLSNAYDQSAYFTGAQQPTNRVSWYEAAQFCNWLTSGDKSLGAYQFSGDNTNPGDFLGIDRTAAQATYGTVYVIPTETEWYKAAYHKNDGVTGNYWLYATQVQWDNTPSNALINPDPGNNANFYLHSGYTVGSPDYLTNVGEFENSDSAYGTFDQSGNVWEWNETLVDGPSRGCRGGGYDYGLGGLNSGGRGWQDPANEAVAVGFRIAEIPEPCSLVLLSLGGLALRLRSGRALLRKRRA